MKDLNENSGNRLKKTNTRYTLPSLPAFFLLPCGYFTLPPSPEFPLLKRGQRPNSHNMDSPPNEAKNSRLTFPHGQN